MKQSIFYLPVSFWLPLSETSPELDPDGLQAYRLACQVLGVTALPRAVSQWSGPTINLNYRNLGPSGAKALTSALTVGTPVQNYTLNDNLNVLEIGPSAKVTFTNHFQLLVNVTMSDCWRCLVTFAESSWPHFKYI